MPTGTLEILYEDNHLLCVVKPPGMLSQGDRTGDVSLLDAAKAYIKKKYQKPGNVYLGLVHRLDRPVGGVVVFARTSKAARRLSAAFRGREVEKHYLAAVSGRPDPEAGELLDFLKKSGTKTIVTTQDDPDGKEARLRYRTLETVDEKSLVSIELLTGRRHQIRVQLAQIGSPVIGDVKYGGKRITPGGVVALYAHRLVIPHPVSGDPVELSSLPPDVFPWSLFHSK
ncbi:MAG: RNA pseudouridine synthase [Deltaproteobacteria bacterium]|nr:RNA pseudouridine synthase [Candidatus Zymogenaceae bacterium]